jgi:hypothetical protein
MTHSEDDQDYAVMKLNDGLATRVPLYCCGAFSDQKSIRASRHLLTGKIAVALG